MKLIIFILFISVSSWAQENIQVKQRYYGVFEYKSFDEFKTVQNLTPENRQTLDLKELELELELKLEDQSQIEIGVEFEHGGTGSTIEYDNFEEFGEFESETEKGGEVAIAEAFYKTKIHKSTYLLVGKAPLYLTLNSGAASPLDSASAKYSQLEERMLPSEWSEVGVQSETRLSDSTIRAGLVSGLNSEFFRKYNWVGGGYQKQFEKVNADNLAQFVSLEYGDALRGRGVALGYYYGNTAKNRHKRDKLTVDAVLQLWSLMGSWSYNNLTLTGEKIIGTLSNSEAVVTANNTLGGLAKPGNFGSLGAKAEMDSLQLRWDLNEAWAVFAQLEHVNTFAAVQGSIFADPRYEVQQYGLGAVHYWGISFIKMQAWTESTQLDGLPDTHTYLVQFGFDTKEF